ncbi:MAG TPA: chloramphenicol acetyltransferase [Candidatus Scatomorpha gallistercoris]|nr:chloramphenicol acetyltransferase [Candidatus Scatomorpha gallistercoris]
MGKRYIDMDAYPRRAHFEYFSSMANPYMGVTVELDITDFCSRIKELGRPFFLSLLWCVNRAADSVPEFRQRIEAGRIVEFDSCRTSHTLALDDGTYCYCQLRASMPLGEYIAYASAEQERARSEQSLDDGDGLDLYFISTLPWLSYTSLVNPTPTPADSNPRLTWGKWFERGGRRILPFTALCNHALVDGAHLAQFFDALRAEMGGI